MISFFQRKVEMSKILNKYIGNREFYSQIFSIAIPIMIQSFVTSFVNLIDNIMIGSTGSDALTAVAMANKYYLICHAVIFGLSGAASIFISQYFGAKEHKKCQNVFNIIIGLAFITGTVFMSLIWIFPNQIIGFFSDTDDIIKLTSEYMAYIKFSYIPYAMSFTTSICLRAVGINKPQLKIGVTTVLLNVILNYILIYGNFGAPELGVEGAAIATVIARLVELSLYFSIIYRKKYNFELNLREIVFFDKNLFRSLVKIALPLMFNELLFSVGHAVVFASYMSVDERLVAAISVADTVSGLAFVMFGGLSSAVSIMVGKKLGAGEIDSAKENAIKLITFGGMIGLGVAIIFFVAAPCIPLLYNYSDEINNAIIRIVRIKGFLIPVYSMYVCSFNIVRSGGDAVSTLIMDGGFLWIAMVPISILLKSFTTLGLVDVYLIVENLEILKLFTSLYFIKLGRWAKNLT